MKKYMGDVLQVLLGIFFGACIVMILMSIMIYPVWVLIPILMILFVIAMAFALRQKGAKPAWIVIGSFVFGLWGFNLYYHHTCGPNSADVKVMKPMAEKISEYIVKNGIPESLKDIPDLPYGLEGCERKQENLEKCMFYENHTKYEIEIYILGDTNIDIYSEKTKTGLRYELKKNSSSNQWFIDKRDIEYSSENSGICNPLRQ
jgi:hypothetical protein